MNELIAYLRENVILDFQGDLNLEMIRDFLKGDDSRDARRLLERVVKEGSVEDMMIVLADCLTDRVKAVLTDQVVRENLRTYSES